MDKSESHSTMYHDDIANSPLLRTLDLVKYKKDPVNARIVGSWPRAFNNEYSLSLGFVLHPGGFRQIVENFKADVEAGRA